MTTTTLTTAMIEAAAHAICRRQEFSERNWRNYMTDAKWALEAAFAVVKDEDE